MEDNNIFSAGQNFNHSSKIHDFDHVLNNFKIDTISIPQIKLDLSNRVHTNFLSWKGQFSPELIETFLSKYAQKNNKILDPFVGCGTTLFECIYQSLHCIGIDVNPAAYELSKTALFGNVRIEERMDIIKKAEKILTDVFPNNMFLELNVYESNLYENELKNAFLSILDRSKNENEYVQSFILNVIMRYHSLKKRKIKNKIFYAFNFHKNIVLRNIPYINKEIKVINGDSRKMDIKNNEINLIITSPPYINVFNYHQNYREIMELYRSDILNIAKSEIGSNRKYRGNRFLTVLQYSLDMSKSFNEMKRVLTKDGRMIIIIGRESKIRDVNLSNFKIISSIAVLHSGFELINRQVRKFTNQFGKEIFEDILHFKPNDIQEKSIDPINIGKYYLREARSTAPDKVKLEIDDALEKASTVKPSPLLFDHIL